MYFRLVFVLFFSFSITSVMAMSQEEKDRQHRIIYYGMTPKEREEYRDQMEWHRWYGDAIEYTEKEEEHDEEKEQEAQAKKKEQIRRQTDQKFQREQETIKEKHEQIDRRRREEEERQQREKKAGEQRWKEWHEADQKERKRAEATQARAQVKQLDEYQKRENEKYYGVDGLSYRMGQCMDGIKEKFDSMVDGFVQLVSPSGETDTPPVYISTRSSTKKESGVYTPFLPDQMDHDLELAIKLSKQAEQKRKEQEAKEFRALREEQDRAYEEALKQDQQKEQQ